jgi:hypothetical protein
MSDTGFVAGFVGRRDAAGAALRQAYAAKGVAFAPRDITPTPPGDPTQPRHFSPIRRPIRPRAGIRSTRRSNRPGSSIRSRRRARRGMRKGSPPRSPMVAGWANATRRCSNSLSRRLPTTAGSIANGSPRTCARP